MPIEVFSKLKTFLESGRSLSEALLSNAAQDMSNWFTHCGYLLPIPECN
jgi:hypothetical protein